jgi:hypothetical protein
MRPVISSALVVLLSLTASAPAGAAGPAPRRAPAVTAETSPGRFTGDGFDACSAPSTQAMQAWLASPYRAVGIYFGGVNRACTQPNLTASWVTDQQAAGWHLMPIYLGPQPYCTTSTKPNRFDLTNAAALGRGSADDAVVQAGNIGLPRESVLIYDMEAYRTDDANCRSAVLAFMNAWTNRLHDLSYLSGFYSSMASGVADQVAAYPSAAYARPDYLDFARWDNVATVSDPAIPADYWAPRRRIKQYRGDHTETWGGVTINIDNDYLDVAPLQGTPFADYNGNGWSDLIARSQGDGRLLLYPGNGSYLTSPTVIGIGWNGMNVIARLGDFDRDGYEDLVARETATGDLWLYPNNVSVSKPRVFLGLGWGAMREITPVGDLDRDGYHDVVAIRPDGVLVLYPGRGTALAAPVVLGGGWNALDELAGVGDFTGDGVVDLLARARNSAGDLYIYPGQTAGLGAPTWLGWGWNTMRDIVGVGDFNRDGHTDVMAMENASGSLYLYEGNGAVLARRVYLGFGWQAMRPLV